MNDEARQLYAKLAKAQAALVQAKRDLEQLRVLGEEAQQTVTALRTEVHSLKDQLAGMAGAEGEVADG